MSYISVIVFHIPIVPKIDNSLRNKPTRL